MFGFLGANCKQFMPSIQTRCVWNMLFYIYIGVYLVNNLPTCTLESFTLNTNWLDMVSVIDRVCYIKLNHSLSRHFEKKFRDELLGKCSLWKKIFYCIHYLHLIFHCKTLHLWTPTHIKGLHGQFKGPTCAAQEPFHQFGPAY